MSKDSLAKKIKKARRSANFSQKQLAKKLELSEKTISAYEKGRAIPPVPTLERIANYTEKPIQFFIENGNSDPMQEISDKLDIIIGELRRLNKEK